MVGTKWLPLRGDKDCGVVQAAAQHVQGTGPVLNSCAAVLGCVDERVVLHDTQRSIWTERSGACW